MGMGTKIHLKFLPLSDHHSHFWAATFDFRTFFARAAPFVDFTSCIFAFTGYS